MKGLPRWLALAMSIFGFVMTLIFSDNYIHPLLFLLCTLIIFLDYMRNRKVE